MEKLFSLEHATAPVKLEYPTITNLSDKYQAAQAHPEAINALRQAQSAWLSDLATERNTEAGNLNIFNVPGHLLNTYSVVLAENTESIKIFNEEYLTKYVDKTDPSYASQLTKLNEYSVTSMSDEKWYLGTKTTGDKYDSKTSGLESSYAYWDTFGGTKDIIKDDDDTIETDEEKAERLVREEAERLAEADKAETERIETERLALEKAELDALEADKATIETSLNTAKTLLDTTRANLAKVQTKMRHRFLVNGPKIRKDRRNARKAYNTAVKDYAQMSFEKLRADNPSITPEELTVLSQIYTAQEFGKMLNEQKKPENIEGKYGKAVRRIGEMSVTKKIVATSVLAVAAPALYVIGAGAATGLAALGAVRVGRSLIKGTAGHSRQASSERVLRNVINQKNAVSKLTRSDTSDKAFQRLGSTATDSDILETITDQQEHMIKRIERSDKVRRIGTAAMTALALAPLVNTAVHRIRGIGETKQLAKEAVIDKSTPKVPKTVVAPSTPPVASSVPLPTGRTLSTGGLNPSSGNTLPSPSDSFANAQGTYPWHRAVDAFNGDQAQANAWLRSTAKKAGIRVLRGNDGIDTNDIFATATGSTKTEDVWRALINAR